MGSSRPYTIYYFRPPDNEMKFNAELLYQDKEIIVTSLILSGASKPLVISGKTVIDNGYRAVFAEYRNKWHDVAKIFNTQGVFTGYYADINTPSEERPDGYWTKDLFLDLWFPPDLSSVTVLDEDEFEEAALNRWISPEEAASARNEMTHLIGLYNRREFPPKLLEQYS